MYFYLVFYLIFPSLNLIKVNIMIMFLNMSSKIEILIVFFFISEIFFLLLFLKGY